MFVVNMKLLVFLAIGCFLWETTLGFLMFDVSHYD